MEIAGEWYRCDDEVRRPVVRTMVRSASGEAVPTIFLIDTGADRTVFNADLLDRLNVTATTPPDGHALVGVGGGSSYVTIPAVLIFNSLGGRTATIRGDYAAFTQGSMADLNILGRDVLDLFHVIVSKRRSQVSLLFGDHEYTIRHTPS